MADQLHTPGPWVVLSRTSVQDIEGPGYVRVASLGSPEYHQNAANAHLIAAAPDLLAALRDVREELYEIRDQDSVPVGTEIYLRAMQALETINAAIAKAEGGNHV